MFVWTDMLYVCFLPQVSVLYVCSVVGMFDCSVYSVKLIERCNQVWQHQISSFKLLNETRY